MGAVHGGASPDPAETFWVAQHAAMHAENALQLIAGDGARIAVRISSAIHRHRVRRTVRFMHRLPTVKIAPNFSHLRPSYVSAGDLNLELDAAKDLDEVIRSEVINVVRPAWEAAVGKEAKRAILLAFELDIIRRIVPFQAGV